MKKFSPFSWISSLYFVEGLPNAIVSGLSVAFYKSMGMANEDIALLTGAMYLPWAFKGLWGPLVDSISTKRRWIFFCSVIFSACFLGLCAGMFSSAYIVISAVIFWILAFTSATFDIAADGFYMLALNEQEQSFYVGIRSAFYRFAVLFGQGAMIFVAGFGESYFNSLPLGWVLSLASAAVIVLLAMLQFAIFLPKPPADIPRLDSNHKEVFANIKEAFFEFIKKPHILSILAFAMFYRFSESQLVKMVQPFMLDTKADGGLGLSLSDVGLIYGTLSPIMLLGGGIVGGIWLSHKGMEKALMPMCLAMNLPNVFYVYMAIFQPDSIFQVTTLIALEQFGYGFGFAGYMVYLMRVSKGKMQTSTYAICTSFMAMSLAIPSMFSGYIQKILGSYSEFFTWVLLSALVSIAVTMRVLYIIKNEK